MDFSKNIFNWANKKALILQNKNWFVRVKLMSGAGISKNDGTDERRDSGILSLVLFWRQLLVIWLINFQ